MQMTVQLSSCPAQSAGLLTVLALHLVKTIQCIGDARLYQAIYTSLRQELCSYLGSCFILTSHSHSGILVIIIILVCLS